MYPGFTCFILAPSIDADAAVVVATLAGRLFAGRKINPIIAAFGASNYDGCPANSAVVLTARHRNTGTALGLEYVVLPLNVAVM